MAYDYSQAGYSPEVTDYLNQLEAQRAALIGKYAGQNVGLDRPDILTPIQVQQPASDEIRTEYLPEEAVRAYMAQNPTITESMFRPGADVRSYGGSRDPSVYDVVRLPYGGEYTLTNKATGQTYKASTPEQIQAIAKMAMGLSTTGTAPMKDSLYGGGNNLANYEITDASGNRIAYDLPYTAPFLSQAGQFLADQAPAVLGAALGGPLGAAALTAGYKGFGQGASLEESLKGGAIAGAKVLAMNAISPYISSGLTSAGLDFPGMNYLFPKDPSFFGALGSTYGGAITPDPGVSEAVLSGVAPGSFYPGVGALAGVLPAQLATSGVPSPSDSITVTKTKPPTVSLLPTAASALTDLNYDTGEQLGYGDKPTTEAPKEDGEGLSTSDYVRLGLTGASLLGGLFGGAGAKDGTGTIPQGFSTALPSTFSAKLPTGSAIPAFGGGVTPESRMGRTAADLGDIDYTRYGFGPERSFFVNVPQRAAKGGPMAVQNISDGRSDDIPAVLSDGEYVIDAETVALLGNGSNKAGAKQLDRFRANIRKHKGKELAKGRFSVNAKKPQAYLAGGRT